LKLDYLRICESEQIIIFLFKFEPIIL